MALGVAASGSVSGQARAADAVPNATVLDHPRVGYLSHCGGCHGIEGYSGNTFVPTLRNAVGAFACTDEGREYLIRVPGVSMSLIRDDQELADIMNFVMLQLAGTSLPKGFHPYTAVEIHEWRQHPLSVPDFMTHRGQVLERSLAACARATDK
ncbi:cystathionine beta-lyase [Acetobacter sp. LMG 1627]|uniref:Cystathionine beta-lyase n=2 Tax=Acetobacter conturbans TaxID=1737472 RepID=A0ABX0K686_9PROT|nr:cystathionine beta-lyase [Acetobacter conturbans]